MMDGSGVPSGAEPVTIVPSIHSSLGPKLRTIRMVDPAGDLDVQSGQRRTLDVPAEPDR
jgi:hypothetical protein